ncbi:MAG: DUF3696 domain-containing protein [Lachnospiraceae bacterium]|nr:DUF3696 domain-containing protein [Lachnospiraceae bacterium]
MIQAVLALYQNHVSSLAGKYMNIGAVSEVRNWIAGSKKIFLEASYEDQGKEYFYSKFFTDEDQEERRGTVFPDKMNIRYLTADRIGVEDTYAKSLEGKEQIGVRCEYAFFYLAVHQNEKVKEKDFIYDKSTKVTLGGQVDYWLERILGYRISAEEIPGTELIRVSYSDRELGKNIRPKNVGTGVSYIAEIIIAAFSCKIGDVLIVENPEIHLHPSGQAELMGFLVFLARQGLQIIMETHSDHIFNGLRRCVSGDQITRDKVCIYFFWKDEEKLSVPVEIILDEDRHVKNQQDGLFDQIEKDLDIILGW